MIDLLAFYNFYAFKEIEPVERDFIPEQLNLFQKNIYRDSRM